MRHSLHEPVVGIHVSFPCHDVGMQGVGLILGCTRVKNSDINCDIDSDDFYDIDSF